MASEEPIDNLYTIIKPQAFNLFGSFLTSCGCIPSTRLEDTGNGFVKGIVDQFKDKSQFKLVISPKGTTRRGSWRSGYYYIREGLECDITTAGLDYEQKTIHVGPIYSHDQVKNMSRDELSDLLANDLGEVVPLHIENSEIDISRDYETDSIGLINWPLFLLVILIIVLLMVTLYLLWGRLRDNKE